MKYTWEQWLSTKFVRDLYEQGFNTDDIFTVICTILDTCPWCWDHDRNCTCTRDE